MQATWTRKGCSSHLSILYHSVEPQKEREPKPWQYGRQTTTTAERE